MQGLMDYNLIHTRMQIHAHNEFIDILAAYGIVSFSIFVCLLKRIVRGKGAIGFLLAYGVLAWFNGIYSDCSFVIGLISLRLLFEHINEEKLNKTYDKNYKRGYSVDKLVSILMCTYNEPISWLKQSINSILNQSYKNIEFIIILDNPLNIEHREYLEKIRSNNPGIKIFTKYNEKNLGLVKSLNRGLMMCHGEYIARMDADDISCATRIEEQIKFLENNNLDIIGSQIEYFTDEKSFGTGDCCFTNYWISKTLKYQGGLAHPSWLGKKAIFDKLNGYREVDTCEDYDFLCRARLSGYRLGNINQVLLKYRINENGISITKASKQELTSKLIGDAFIKKNIVEINQLNELDFTNIFNNKVLYTLYLLKKKVMCKFYRTIDHLIWVR